MKLNIITTALLAAAALVATSSNSNAGIMTGDYENAGDGLITIDSDTGLEWLNWTVTTNLSYNDMLTELGAGGSYEGWRHATREEVRIVANNIDQSLIADPLAPIYYHVRQDAGAAVNNINSYLGFTNPVSPTNKFSLALTSDTYTRASDGALFQLATVTGANTHSVLRQDYTYLQHVEHYYLGHALVRLAAVPEPTSLMCWLGLGLVGLTRRRRNRDRRFPNRF